MWRILKAERLLGVEYCRSLADGGPWATKGRFRGHGWAQIDPEMGEFGEQSGRHRIERVFSGIQSTGTGAGAGWRAETTPCGAGGTFCEFVQAHAGGVAL